MNEEEFKARRFSEKRRILVESLRQHGICDESLLAAMSVIPREFFVSPAFINRAYEDTALPIICSQTISQPYTVAFQTQLLKVKKGDKILEIGTGSGYQACILAEMGARVFTVERIPELYQNAVEIFNKYSQPINIRLADGTLGWKEFSPFDGIIVTAAAPVVPKSLLAQLTVGGRLVIPVGDKDSQSMLLIEKYNENGFNESKSDRFKFVPLIGKEGWQD